MRAEKFYGLCWVWGIGHSWECLKIGYLRIQIDCYCFRFWSNFSDVLFMNFVKLFSIEFQENVFDKCKKLNCFKAHLEKFSIKKTIDWFLKKISSYFSKLSKKEKCNRGQNFLTIDLNIGILDISFTSEH